jgi:protein-S-isoprenylcysteine O-methyltransferase Ste14
VAITFEFDERSAKSTVIAIAIVVALVVYLLPLGMTGYEMLARYERGAEGAFYGVVFGAIGLVLVWTIRQNEQLNRVEAAEKHQRQPSPAGPRERRFH